MGTIHIPLDGLHADGAHRVDGAVVIIAVGQADQGGPDAGDLFDLVIAGVQVGHHLIGGELRVMGVGIGVVHHLVARVGEGLHRFGVLIHPLAHHEKGGGDVVLPQNIDELLGVLVAPCGVEADGHQLLVPLDAVDGQLPRGGGGPHGGRVIDHIEHCRRQTEAGCRRPPLFFDEENLDVFPFFCHHYSTPVPLDSKSYEKRAWNMSVPDAFFLTGHRESGAPPPAGPAPPPPPCLQ